MFERLVIATHNKNEIEHLRALLTTYAGKIVSLEDLKLHKKPFDTGETAEENALILAHYYSTQTKLPVIAKSEAIYADFLARDQQPGVHYRETVNGRSVSDLEFIEHWNNIFQVIPSDKRLGHWHVAYALVRADGQESTIAFDHAIFFYSPPSPAVYPNWPMLSLEGPVEYHRPRSELTPTQTAALQKRNDAELKKRLVNLFMTQKA